MLGILPDLMEMLKMSVRYCMPVGPKCFRCTVEMQSITDENYQMDMTDVTDLMDVMDGRDRCDGRTDMTDVTD